MIVLSASGNSIREQSLEGNPLSSEPLRIHAEMLAGFFYVNAFFDLNTKIALASENTAIDISESIMMSVYPY
jgi:hypothetical protein